MPSQIFSPDYAFLSKRDLLTFEELRRLVGAFAKVGTSKVRLTGGEPLLRRGLADLVAMIADIRGIDDVAITTNGAALSSQAESLARAGLGRVTVSLDALEDRTFGAMNDVQFPVARVLAGIEAATDAGLATKVNMVVQRGVNDQAILEMAEHFRWTGVVLRFIEFMDVGTTNGWHADQVVSAHEIASRIERRWPLTRIEPNYAGEVARRYRYCDGGGEIGLIAAVTQPFCGGCTRARVSADGQFYTCLFAAKGENVRALLRAGASEADLVARIASVWSGRADRYSELRQNGDQGGDKVEMSYIGG